MATILKNYHFYAYVMTNMVKMQSENTDKYIRLTKSKLLFWIWQ